MSKEIKQITDALEREKIQEYVPDQLANQAESNGVKPVCDLLKEGSKQSSLENLRNQGDAQARVDKEYSEEGDSELDYMLTKEDLDEDNEPSLTETMIDTIAAMADDMMVVN
ncbi:hypothetical protein PQX77_020449 [Marasmius sp. AFHP31]|nr:hypothetical protein PQX77_020449 [Marasmius sp. AFHP31]